MTPRHKAKGRRDSGTFVALPCDVLNGENFCRLSPKANKLLLDLCSQLRMKSGGAVNNGDLSIAIKLMQGRGWTSKQQLAEACDELEHYGFIVLTRQGGRHQPSLYAITWWAINECNGKLVLGFTLTAPGGWG